MYSVFVVTDREKRRRQWTHAIGSIAGCRLAGDAYSLEEALAKIPHHRPDVVLVDLAIGEGQGQSLIRELSNKSLPVVLAAVAAAPGEEVRRHLGVETQRQWPDLVIERTTPCLLGLFSLITFMADQLQRQRNLPVRQTRWYVKEHPTFSDGIAAVRRRLWQTTYFRMSRPPADVIKIPRPLFEHLTTMLAYAA